MILTFDVGVLFASRPIPATCLDRRVSTHARSRSKVDAWSHAWQRVDQGSAEGKIRGAGDG